MYRTIEMPRQGKFRKFLGVSFDVSGSILYAWGNQDTIYGALFAYEFTKETDPDIPIFDGKYQVRISSDISLISQRLTP